MSKNHESHLNNQNRNIKTAAALGLLAATLASAAPSAAANPNANPLRDHEVPTTSATVKASQTEAVSTAKAESTEFQKLMDSRVRRTVIQLAGRLNKGPAKPNPKFESWVGPNRMNTVSFGSPDSSEGEYEVTTMAPVLPSGNINKKKIFYMELKAGNGSSLTFSRDYATNDWTVYGVYAQPQNGEPEAVRAAVDPSEAGDLVLGPRRLTAARNQALQLLDDAHHVRPFRHFNPPF